jgi:hypothetical protein
MADRSTTTTTATKATAKAKDPKGSSDDRKHAKRRAAPAVVPAHEGNRALAIFAVVLALVLVLVLGGLALHRVSARFEARRDAFAADARPSEVDAGPGPTDDVALVGDSITEQSETTLHTVLDRTYRVRVRGRGGYRIEEMEPYAIELATTRPEQVIINLGSNDALKSWPLEKSVLALKRLIADFKGTRCLHLVTVNEAMVNDRVPDLKERTTALNAEIRHIAATENFNVIDWSRAVVDDIAAGSPNGGITSDTVHPTENGQKVLAELYATALATCD